MTTVIPKFLLLQKTLKNISATSAPISGHQTLTISLYLETQRQMDRGDFNWTVITWVSIYLVHGDAVSIVPTLIGTAPATVDGTVVLEDERGNAFALLESFDENQKKKAIQKGRRGLKVGAGRSTDPFLNHDYSEFVGIGLKASEMNDTQKAHLRNLIKTYVYNLETEFADVWMADIDAGLDDTYFVWIGGTTPNDPIYYRVFNPDVWIEFNNESGLDHIHTIIRSPNGNDYGIFASNHGAKTLLEHYTLEDHHKISEALFDYGFLNLQDIENMEAH